MQVVIHVGKHVVIHEDTHVGIHEGTHVGNKIRQILIRRGGLLNATQS